MSFLFFFNDTATTEIYTLSLHDALPIYFYRRRIWIVGIFPRFQPFHAFIDLERRFVLLFIGNDAVDRKSTRLNSSHGYISYAVFCLKKKKISIYTSLIHDQCPVVTC